MVQAASLSPRRPGFAAGSILLGFVDRVALGQVFLELFGFPLSISFHRRSPSHIICGMSDPMSGSGSSSETCLKVKAKQSHNTPIEAQGGDEI
jgi:hypothetical protein